MEVTGDPADLVHLAVLPRIGNLFFFVDMDFAPAAIPRLSRLKQLDELEIDTSALAPEDLETLRRALPYTRINGQPPVGGERRPRGGGKG